MSREQVTSNGPKSLKTKVRFVLKHFEKTYDELLNEVSFLTEEKQLNAHAAGHSFATSRAR